MAQQMKKSKKRMMNAKLKEKRARSWAAGEKRKKANAAANEARHQANLASLKEEGLSPQKEKRPSKLLRLYVRAKARGEAA